MILDHQGIILKSVDSLSIYINEYNSSTFETMTKIKALPEKQGEKILFLQYSLHTSVLPDCSSTSLIAQ